MPDPVVLHVKNDLAEIERVHLFLNELEQQRSVPQDVVFAVTLALDEVLTNTISYGYADSDEHIIDITFHIHDDAIEAIICDDGIAFNPLEAQPPDLDVPLEERKIGGLGIHLVRTFMDDVIYRRDSKRNILMLRKLYSAGG